MTDDLKQVIIYTDGACIGNPGPGGYGVVLKRGRARKELSAGFQHTTNNRMELMAAIAGLELLREPCRVQLFTDSRYLADAMQQGWAQQWRSRKWKREKGGRALNPDLWGRLLDLCERHQVEFIWIKGHADTPENERCDQLAQAAARQNSLPPDPGYEQTLADTPPRLF